MINHVTAGGLARWELAAEAIAVKIRWFGRLVGFLLVNVGDPSPSRPVVNAILSLGAVYALVDTYYSLRGEIFLRRYPLSISLLEALFIGLLCYFHGGLESSFRYYYILSLLCCAVRYPSRVTYATCALHCASFGLLYLALPPERRDPVALSLTLVVLGWLTWAGDAMSLLLKRVGDHLGRLNDALRENQATLEARIEERTHELREAQARLLHQEKMAAFGLLAAGIAHEVGNPLTSISSLVQMLQRRGGDAYSREKLGLVADELKRIQNTLRELVNFSRPAETSKIRVSLREVVEDAIAIAKYYKGIKSRRVETHVPADLPTLQAVRDQLVQAVLNLVLNAVDATAPGGRIEIGAEQAEGRIVLRVRDDGAGVAADAAARLFQPYFTTKRTGTGLGLFVTRQLITDHGGTVGLESRPGPGATFRVELPLQPGPAAAGSLETDTVLLSPTGEVGVRPVGRWA